MTGSPGTSERKGRRPRHGRGALVVLLLLCMLAGVFAAHPAQASASNLQQYQDQLDQLQKQIQQRQAQLDAARRQEQSLKNKLNTTTKNLNQTKKQLAAIQAQLQVLNAEIAKAEQDLAMAQQQLEYRQALLSLRLRAIYQRGVVGYLDVLLSATSFSDFLTRFTLLRKIVEQDVSLFQQIRMYQGQVEQQKALLVSKQQQASVLRDQVSVKKASYEKQVATQQSQLASVQATETETRAALDQLEAESQKIQALLQAELAKEGLPARDLHMIFPLPFSVPLTSDFGRRYHPILHEWRTHTGIDLAAATGTPIYAAESGRVVRAEYMTGYGNTVIIDHGGGIATLYGHMSRIEVQAGQMVVRGQEIGRVGATGWATGPHLHFEVRVDGVPVDPKPYIPHKWY